MPPQTYWRKGSIPFDPTKQYGYMDVIEFDEERSSQYEYMRYWKCRCRLCGTIKSVKEDHLKNGKTLSCGCYRSIRSTKHGMVGTPEYEAWQNMNQRCTNKNHPQWEDYGGRGILVCQKWRESFEEFYQDLGQRPTERHSLERVDNDRGYEPGNVEWKTMFHQSRNKRTNRRYELEGESLTLTDWCNRFNVNLSTVKKRLRNGMGLKEALSTPPDPSHQRPRKSDK